MPADKTPRVSLAEDVMRSILDANVALPLGAPTTLWPYPESNMRAASALDASIQDEERDRGYLRSFWRPFVASGTMSQAVGELFGKINQLRCSRRIRIAIV